MKVLVTGALGNIGTSTVEALVSRGHTVRGFELDTPKNRKKARRMQKRLGKQVEFVWGDLRRMEDVVRAVEGQDVVVHLAFIIPKLSSTGVESERKPEWARSINVGGTQNLIRAMEAMEHPPRLIFMSSYHVYGRTQHLPPPRRVGDPLRPVEHYSMHKIECERMVQASKLEWAIFRLAAALPISIRLDPGMFDVPLENRIEFVHTRDVGTAIARAVDHPEVWGKILHIAGGPRCQYVYREIVERILGALGVGMLPEEAFATEPFPTDWVDTEESQRLLGYQQRDIDDYVRDMMKQLGYLRPLILATRPFVRWWLLGRSPYWRARKPRGEGFVQRWNAFWQDVRRWWIGGLMEPR